MQPMDRSPEAKAARVAEVAKQGQASREQQDEIARLTLGQINERIAPLSISVGGLSTLGFEPVAVVKAARLYKACDFGAICRAISERVLAAAEQIAETA